VNFQLILLDDHQYRVHVGRRWKLADPKIPQSPRATRFPARGSAQCSHWPIENERARFGANRLIPHWISYSPSRTYKAHPPCGECAGAEEEHNCHAWPSPPPPRRSITLSIEAKLRRTGKGKRLVIANGAEAEVNAGLVELIKDAFTIRIQLGFKLV
jgi:hypothetical protein